jgi:hypothetical protein
MKRTIILVMIAAVIIGSCLVIIRFLAGGKEDAWVCADGQWVRHGNPWESRPQEPCTSAKAANEPETASPEAAAPQEPAMILPAEKDFFRDGELLRNRPDLATKGWYLVYSRLGLTPVTIRLAFDKDSKCLLNDEPISCSALGPDDVMPARVEGYQLDPETVLVRNLTATASPK